MSRVGYVTKSYVDDEILRGRSFNEMNEELDILRAVIYDDPKLKAKYLEIKTFQKLRNDPK